MVSKMIDEMKECLPTKFMVIDFDLAVIEMEKNTNLVKGTQIRVSTLTFGHCLIPLVPSGVGFTRKPRHTFGPCAFGH